MITSSLEGLLRFIPLILFQPSKIIKCSFIWIQPFASHDKHLLSRFVREFAKDWIICEGFHFKIKTICSRFLGILIIRFQAALIDKTMIIIPFTNGLESFSVNYLKQDSNPVCFPNFTHLKFSHEVSTQIRREIFTWWLGKIS